MTLSNDLPEDQSRHYYTSFEREAVYERLRALDRRAAAEGLDALRPDEDPLIRIGMEIDASGRVTKNSYGVFNLAWQAERNPGWPAQIAAEIAEIRGRIAETHHAPLRFLIWAGMGGSAEDKSMYAACGLLRRGPRCYVLDSTDPAKLKCILDDIDKRHGLPITSVLRSTLVVGQALGMTSYEPVVNLEKLAGLYERYRIDSRPNFIYMTLPGSLLDCFGHVRGYRKIELQFDNGNSTSGRHSSPLTRGSLYPLALAKVDLKEWIEATFLTPEQVHTAWHLAAFLHAQGLAGRDKVTLLLPKPWAGAGIWTKQNFEESLGKSEQLGIKIVLSSKPRLANYRSPKDCGQDRAFLAIQVKGLTGPDTHKIGVLRRAGYPVACVTFPAGSPLSHYMQFVHYTVFGVAWLREMNFVTQPSVELYKSIANRIYEQAGPAGGTDRTAAWQAMMRSPRQAGYGPVTLHFDRLCLQFEAASGASAPEIYAAIIRKLRAEGRMEYAELTFFGDTRYCARGQAVRKILDRAAERLFRARLKAAVDVYEGPAMNHSYHEMIIGHGRCFSTVLLSEQQEHLAAARYSADYHLAQFLATQAALAERGRPVVAITLKNMEEESRRALEEFFHRAAAHLKPGRI